jgi:hypothetical protein
MFDRLKCLLIVPAVLTLTGCPAGPAPLVGWESNVPEVGSRNVCCGINPTIVEKTYEHRYDLVFSPDGDRKNVRLKSHFEYVLLRPGQPPQKLPFLTTSTQHNHDGRFTALYPVDDDRLWAGYGVAPDTDERDGGPASDSWHYFVKVFTQDGIVHQANLEVLKTDHRIDIDWSVPAFRFHHRNGMALYHIRTGKVTLLAPAAG